jgi:hypothetical protein
MWAHGTPSGTQTAWASSVAVTYIGNGNVTSNLTALDFGNFSAASNGVMVVFYGNTSSSNSRAITSIDIGGSAGVMWTALASSAGTCAAAYRGISSGANNVTVNMSGLPGNTNLKGVQVFLVTGYNNPDPVWSDSIPANGVVIASATSRALTYPYQRVSKNLFSVFHLTPEAISWSNASEDNENIQVSGVWAAATRTGGSTLLDVESTTETSTCTTSSNHVLMGAGWV